MFEVGFTELLVISVLALIVLGPERLPKVVSEVGRWMGRARAMARQFREQLEDEVTIDLNASPKPTAPAAATATATAAATASTAPADAPVAPGLYDDPDLRHNDYPGAAYTPVDDAAVAPADPYAAPSGTAPGAVAEAAADANPASGTPAAEPGPSASGDDGHEQRRA
jgi:Tat protein translocase TatB subunit